MLTTKNLNKISSFAIKVKIVKSHGGNSITKEIININKLKHRNINQIKKIKKIIKTILS